MAQINQTSEKEVKLASLAGFCYGVKRAVDLCLKVKQQNPEKKIFVLGQLIHNNQAIEYLEQHGINTIDSIEGIPTGSMCVIRSHGVGPTVLKELKARNIEIVDATCPDVKRVQKMAAGLAQENYQVIILGQPDHPEVKAIEEHINSQEKQAALIFSSIKDVETNKDKLLKSKKLGVVVQTTQTIDTFTSLISKIVTYCYEIKIFNTICDATAKRQNQAQELAATVDFMIVVGSKKSANTTHLAQICKSINPNMIHVENAEELESLDLTKYKTIGVTAGASTPKFVIDDVINFLN